MSTSPDPATPAVDALTADEATTSANAGPRSRTPMTDAERKKRMKARAKRRKELEKQRAKEAKEARKSERSSGGTGRLGGIFSKRQAAAAEPAAELLDANLAQPLDVPEVETPTIALADTPPSAPDPAIEPDAAPVELPTLPEDLFTPDLFEGTPERAVIEQPEPRAESHIAPQKTEADTPIDATEPTSAETPAVADKPEAALLAPPLIELPDGPVSHDDVVPIVVGEHHPTPTTIAATGSIQVIDSLSSADESADDTQVAWNNDVTTEVAESAAPAGMDTATDWIGPSAAPDVVWDATPESPQIVRDRMRPRPRTRPAIPGHASEIRDREREIRERIEAKRRELDALFTTPER